MPMHFVADQPYFTEESVEGFLEKMEREAKVVPGCVTWNGRKAIRSGFRKSTGKNFWNWKEMPEEERCSADTGKKQYFTR